MKRITVNSTIRKTVKIILSISITALLVGLCPREFITVDATDINIEDFPYRTYGYNNGANATGIATVYISDTPINNSNASYTANNYWLDLNTGLLLNKSALPTSGGFYLVLESAKVYCLTYINGEWEISYPYLVMSQLYQATGYSMGDNTIFTTTIPDGFPEVSVPDKITLEDISTIVDDRLNESLNSTTSITSSANSLQSDASNTYISYVNGDITAKDAKQTIDNISQELESLSNTSGATLADLIAINNAQNTTQIAQDAINSNELIATQKPSASVISLVNQKVTEANQTYQNYTNGTLTQSSAVTAYNSYITYLTNLIKPSSTSADIEHINNAIDTIKGIQNSTVNYSDLDYDVSESANASMESEMEFVDSLIAETTHSLEALTPDLSDDESTQALEWIGMLWENEFFKLVLPWCAIAMLVCLVLGVRYRI